MRILSAEVSFATSSALPQAFSNKPFLRLSPRRKRASKCPNNPVRAVIDEPQHPPTSTNGSVNQGLGQESVAQLDDTLGTDPSIQIAPVFQEPWYAVVERIGRDDTEAVDAEEVSPDESDAAVDLLQLDSMGQNMLVSSSYDSVIDIDIEDGGVLDDDEDNNDIHCGVELDALVESTHLVDNLRKEFGIETATHVQLAAIPRVLDGRDLVIQSHTGTGKTLSFLLPILDEIDQTSWDIQAVLIAPTRELAMQISKECDRLILGTEIRNLALIGGANPVRQVEKLRKKRPHIVVGTPGRLAELYEQRELRTSGLRWLVVDEIDQCLGDAFREHILLLLDAVRRKQTILVSATGDVNRVRIFAAAHLNRPILLRVGGAQRIPKRIEHCCCIVPARMKIAMIKKLMNTSPVPKRAIAFVDDPRRVDIVVDRLEKMNLIAGGLRGNAHKLERADVLNAFRKGRINLLVTTEVAARGLDIREISHVFNLDLPTDGDHYLHRAGRCGRAGEEGIVVSIASVDKAFVIGRLATELGIEIPQVEPRNGLYSQPLSRERKERPSAAVKKNEVAAKTKQVKKESGRSRERNRVLKPERSLGKSLVGLSNAVKNGDHEFIETTFLNLAGGESDLHGTETGSAEHKAKPKLKGKRNLKTKAKAKTRQKSKSSKKLENRSADGEVPETKGTVSSSNEEYVQVSDVRKGRDERRLYNRARNDITQRAAREGWVGNRVATREED